MLSDDGIFFRKTGGKAVCLETTDSKNKNCVGYEIDASAKIPERLAKLYTDLGYTDDDIIYKADTSSDEITIIARSASRTLGKIARGFLIGKVIYF